MPRIDTSTRHAPAMNRHAPVRFLIVSLVILLTAAGAQARESAPEPTVPTLPDWAATTPGVLPGEDVILPALRGLVFVPSNDAVRADPPMPATGYDTTGWPVLQNAFFDRIIRPYLGQPVSVESLDRLTTGLRYYLAMMGRPFSVVFIPPQDVTGGVVQVVLLLAVADQEVAVEGGAYFSEQQYRSLIRQHAGEPIDTAALKSDLDWINRNPFRSATSEMAQGTRPGTTRIVLRVQERRPWTVFTSASNAGTRTTKIGRFSAGFNWGNAFGRGHQLSAQWSSSWDFETLRSISGSYAIDLPWRHSLSISGAYSRTHGVVAQPFALDGLSWQMSVNYDVPLRSTREGFTQALQFGADFKASDNNFTFAAMPISGNLTHVAQARFTYRGSLTSGWGTTAFDTTLTAAPGGLTDRNRSRYFDRSRAGARADYVYLRANGSHRVDLGRLLPGLTWSVRGQVQWSNHNLIGSEQFAGGGAYSVRGYEEGEVYKDNGLLLSQELRLPAWSPAWGGERFRSTLQGFVFQDFAALWSTVELPGETATDLHSVGVGVDYYVGRNLSVRGAVGWQLRSSGQSDNGDHHRAHVSARLSF